MRRIIVVGLALAALLVGGAVAAHAQTASSTAPTAPIQITFPIAELGGCLSKDACRAYCDDSAHAQACITFAESHGLVHKEEADQARSIAQDIKENGGPGGCTSPSACKAFCSQDANRATCIAFAAAHGLTHPEGMLKGTGKPEMIGSSTPPMKKGDDNGARIDALLKVKGGPGGCTTREACKEFCSLAANHDVCLKFAQANGLMSKEDVDKAHNLIDVLKNGGPGGCTSPESCKAFCSEDANRDTCMQFAEAHGFAKPGAMMHEGDNQDEQGTTTWKMPPPITGTSTAKWHQSPNDLHSFSPNMDEIRKKCAENPDACAKIMQQYPQLQKMMQGGAQPPSPSGAPSAAGQ